jgi:hypothetical protein
VVWHRPLFDLGLYIIVVGLVAALIAHWTGIGAPLMLGSGS